MIGEIVKIIAKIVQGINNNYSLEQVEKSLNNDTGMNKNAVAAAYSWIYEKMTRDLFIERELVSHSEKSIRFLSDEEKFEIGLDNYNYLLHFYNIGMIKTDEFNSILEQLKLFPEGTVSQENINMLILSLFLDIDNYSVPGSRNLLYSSDTIN